MLSILTTIAVILTLIVFGMAFRGRIPKPYRYRKCVGYKWKSEFPNIPKAMIQDYLNIFVNAFAFEPKNKLKFEPEDKILDILNSMYPIKGYDSMEIESFADQVEKTYNIDFASVWTESLTLGDLFQYVLDAKKNLYVIPE